MRVDVAIVIVLQFQIDILLQNRGIVANRLDEEVVAATLDATRSKFSPTIYRGVGGVENADLGRVIAHPLNERLCEKEKTRAKILEGAIAGSGYSSRHNQITTPAVTENMINHIQ